MARIDQALAHLVSGTIRHRGQSYLQQGRVTLLRREAALVTAAVTGSKPYHVEIEQRGEALVVCCTCPAFADQVRTCKHIWAVILAAGRQGYLEPHAGATPVRIKRRSPLPQAPAEQGRAGVSFPTPPRPPQPPPPPSWRTHLAAVSALSQPERLPPVGEILYVIDVAATAQSGMVVLQMELRGRRAGGELGRPRPLKLDRRDISARVADPLDRQILALLAGAEEHWSLPSWQAWRPLPPDRLSSSVQLPDPLLPLVLPLLAASGRASMREDPQAEPGPPLSWDGGEPWKLCLSVACQAQGSAQDGGYVLEGSLRRGDERLPLNEARLTFRSGFVVTADNRVAPFDHAGAFAWVPLLWRVRRLDVPAAEGDDLVAQLYSLPGAPQVELPAELRCAEVAETPTSRLLFLDDPSGEKWQPAAVSFRYSAADVWPGSHVRTLFRSAPSRQLIRRDLEAESRALDRLPQLGFQRLSSAPSDGADAAHFRLERRRVAATLPILLAEGWLVEAQGRPLRAPGLTHVGVRSRLDWFELAGGVEFDGETVPFPELLAALGRGETTVRLPDGSSGLLPTDWLRQIAPLAAFGQAEGAQLRFHAAHVGLLDVLLAAEPGATCDATFERARSRLAGFAGIAPAAAPRGFRGELRGYQKAGLGWLHFLRDFGFGGCLADDMGLGKTVQVLALLESRRDLRRRQDLGPSLVVVPRSLIFNWIAEAASFAPNLRVLNHTGLQRDRSGESLTACDLLLTTYGTLRRDAAVLRTIDFDYVVLDEAQAIKNPDSESAKAARLLRGHHRLVLTGTPVENHLGDLWSLLEFLNPGITGSSAVLRSASAELRDPDYATRAQLARGLRPFILRRTKEQVAPELPTKIEQTIFCELPADQRRLYDQLRRHYRAALGERVAERGMNRVKILVLEALLRLRQAACHPALVDPDRAGESCAKLDFLIPQLQEVLDEGHKALVFSQFTSFLALLRRRLDEERMAHAYLDGRTRDRAACVERFQRDPACNLFLVSLKAGGLGLNLTAAEYVYLLDPWWNPAVEAQAIDRAHRIGQTRQVFAYRVVAKDTVEEKILHLQESKRQLADAIVGADDSVLRRLTREDLDLLLS